MEECPVEEFKRAPVGRWAAAGTSVIWCHSPTLCGSLGWGSPEPRDTREVLHVFDGYLTAPMAPQFDVILDGRALEIELAATTVFMDWIRVHRRELQRRIRLQLGIIAEGLTGFILCGLLPTLGDTHPFRVYTDPREAFCSVLGASGETLCDEVDAIVRRRRGLGRERQRLRDLLRESRATIELEGAAKRLGTSVRSLQRVLAEQGTSFREEQLDVRFGLASDELRHSDTRPEVVASRLRISPRALTQLFRARVGVTPLEYRARRASGH